jgi:iron complex transport system ATP-binding protein
VIRTDDLTVKRGGRAVLRGASLSLMPGRVTVILGPNGAGKSTLIKAIAGLPPSPSVMLDDQPLPAIPLAVRARRIGYLPQNGAPAWNVAARELVALGRLPHRTRFAGETGADRSAIDAAMAATDTAHLAARTVDTLSGGELARVKLARLLAGDPDWLLADEPLANLDPAHQRDMLHRLRDAAAAGKGVVVVLHQLDAALGIADDVVLLKDGLVLAHGPAADMLTPAHLNHLFDTAFRLAELDGRRTIVQDW